MSFDKFHQKKDRTYRLYGYVVDEENGVILDGDHDGCTPVPLAKELAESVSGIEYFTRYGSASGTILKDNTPYEEVITMADTAFFEMFDFPILSGSKRPLNDPTSIVLSKENAVKYFGDSSPIGKTLEVILNDSSVTFTVTAVVSFNYLIK